MRRLFSTLLMAGLLSAAAPVLAEENWAPHLPGVTQGLASGALPPEGLYFVNTTLILPSKLYDSHGDKQAVRGDVFVDVPVLLWAPGIRLLGADYAAGLAQPVTYVNTSGGGFGDSAFGHYATVLLPAQLSWSLPEDFHLLAGLGVYLPDGTAQKTVISYREGRYKGVPNSINYWALEPTLGISWLRDGWNISAGFHIDVNFQNPASHYSSGAVVNGDYTVTKTFGKWTLGLGGYSVNQIESDRSADPLIQAGIAAAGGNRQTKYAVGPIIGYNFGAVTLTGMVNHGFGANNVLSGDCFWTRLEVPF